MDTVFRSKVQPEAPEAQAPTVVSDKTVAPQDSEVEVPFTDYQKAHQKPYTVEYFKLGELWDDPDGGFTEEIETLEGYLNHRIEKGELANSVSAIQNEIKDLEKTNGLKKEERITVKLGILSAYAKFLMETDGVRYNARKYGRT